MRFHSCTHLTGGGGALSGAASRTATMRDTHGSNTSACSPAHHSRSSFSTCDVSDNHPVLTSHGHTR